MSARSVRSSAVASHANSLGLGLDRGLGPDNDAAQEVHNEAAESEVHLPIVIAKEGDRKKLVRITVAYEDRRSLFELDDDQTVGDLKKLVQYRFHIRPNVFPCVDEENPSKRVITMTYCGSELRNEWVVADFGFHQGTTIKCFVKEERDPILYVYVSYSGETMKITDPLKLRSMTVSDLKALVSRRLGLPVSVFQLISKEGHEMHSALDLLHYDVGAGDTVRVEIWDGLDEYLNLCALGLTSSILTEANEEDEVMSRFMLRVACYVAAHFGYIDVANTCLRNGVRPDDAVGDHPSRQWNALDWHPDFLKTPIHEAAERGQLGVIRVFVTFDLGCIMANDGYGQKPLNLCLRYHHRQSASYLIARQWTKIPYGDALLSLRIINRMRRWSDRAKERVLIVHGVEKSSLKRKVISHHPRVGQPVYVKGFHASRMQSKRRDMMPAGRPTEAYVLNSKYDLYSTDGLEEYFKTAWQYKSAPLPNNVNAAMNTGGRVTVRLVGKTSRGDRQSHYEPPETVTSVVAPATTTVTTTEESQGRPRRRNSASESWQSTSSNEQPKKSSCAPGLPQIAERERSRGNAPSAADAGSVLTVGGASGVNTSMSKKRSKTELALARIAKVKDMQFPLPGRAEKSLARPYRYVPVGREDMVKSALEAFKEVNGQSFRESAIQCLTIANSFTSKSGPARVRMAIDLAERQVKKTLNSDCPITMGTARLD